MVFTVLAKFYSIEYFCNAKVPGLGKIFGYTVVCWNVHGYFTAVSPFCGPIDKINDIACKQWIPWHALFTQVKGLGPRVAYILACSSSHTNLRTKDSLC